MVPAGDPDDPRLAEALLAYGTEFLLFVDHRGAIRAAVGDALTRSGFTADAADSGRHIGERIHPDDLHALFDLIERARDTAGFHDNIGVRARNDEGTWYHYHATVIAVSRDRVLGTGAVIRARRLGRASPGGDDRFLSLAAALPVGVLSADARGWVVYANDAARAILDLPGEAVLGQGWRTVVHRNDASDTIDAARSALRAGLTTHATVRLRAGGRWATFTFVPLGGGTRRSGWVATVEDITERHRAEAALAHRAYHDSLTGLPNRALLEDRLGQALARRRAADEVAVLFVDLDGFKAINDVHGHAVGDAVLREAVVRLAAVLRPTDTLARLGGDEFVAVLEGVPEPAAQELAARMRRAFTVPALVGERHIGVGASIGVVLAAPQDTPSTLLRRADEAMYRAKHPGESPFGTGADAPIEGE